MKPLEDRFPRSKMLLAFTLAASLLLSGCLVIPHPRNIATAKGVERKKPKLDILKDGVATREDVLHELGDFDTNASQDRFLWARWQQVKVQTEWFAAGGYSAAGGSARSWVIRNVLAGFRDKRVLTEHRVCSEDELMMCIQTMLEFTTPPESPETLLVSSWRGRGLPEDGRAIFENASVAFEHFRKPKQNFTEPLSRVSHLTVSHGSSPELLHFSLHFEKGVKPDSLNLEASPMDTLTLVWLLRSRPQ